MYTVSGKVTYGGEPISHDNYRQFVGRADTRKTDQHVLLALVAPGDRFGADDGKTTVGAERAEGERGSGHSTLGRVDRRLDR